MINVSIIRSTSGNSSVSATTLPDFEAGKHYNENQAIVHGGAIYIAKAAFTAGDEFDPDDWNKVSISKIEFDDKLDKSNWYGTVYVVDEDGNQTTFDMRAFEWTDNRVDEIRPAAEAEDTKYPTEKAVRTELDAKADKTDVETELDKKQNNLTAGDNIDLNVVDPQNPIITAITILPDVAAADGQIADAKKTAAMIAEAVRNTHNRGKVISAYTPTDIWALDELSLVIADAGTGYQVGDSLQYGLKYIDILFVVTETGDSGEILDCTVSATGANDADFSAAAQTGLEMVGGHGDGFTIRGASEQTAGTTLADVATPQPNDEVTIILDEIHSAQTWTWIMADYNGDGIYNWVSLAPSGSTRDFYTDPIETAELDANAVTDPKVADYTTQTTIPESNTKFAAAALYTFLELKNAIVAKINALFSNKLDKTDGAGKIYGTDATGAQTTYDKNDFGKVDTVDDVEPDADKNIQLTVEMTRAEHDALEDPPGSGKYPTLAGKTVTLTDIYPSGCPFPVGSIHLSVDSRNPSALWAGTTWSAWGTGRVPVGFDDTQTEFDAVEKEGGEKVHTLTIAEMPNHNHSGVLSTGTAGNGFGVAVAALATSVGYTGGSGAHNNLQPYIVCYMWKRDA